MAARAAAKKAGSSGSPKSKSTAKSTAKSKSPAGKSSAKKSKTTRKPTGSKRASSRARRRAKGGASGSTARVSKDSASQAPAQEEMKRTPDLDKLRAFQKAQKASKAMAEKTRSSSSKGKKFLAKPPRKGKTYTVDLKVHTPGTLGYFSTGGIDTGEALVRLAGVKKLDMIAVSDYYNADYIDLVVECAEKSKITVIPGVDLCCEIGSCSEVYVTALFPENYDTAKVEGILKQLGVPEEARGREDFTLRADFAEVIKVVEGNGGIMIPSGLDKTPYRQEVLPDLIDRFGFRAFDVVHPDDLSAFRENWPDGEFTFFTFSNANALAQIGGRVTKIKLSEPGFAGLREIVERRPAE